MDTPGGIRGFELSRALQHSDIVLVPVCDSAFDYDASADCIAEMRQHPKIGKGKAQLAVVGLRIQPASVAEGRLRAWATLQDVPHIGSLRSSPLYVHGAAMGLTVFDCCGPGSASDELEDWRPIQHWLDAALVQRNRELQMRKARTLFDGQGDAGSGGSVSGASTLASRARVLAVVRSGGQQPRKLDCRALVAASPLLTAPSRVAGYGPAT
jgi:chromosome partitioning protein